MKELKHILLIQIGRLSGAATGGFKTEEDIEGCVERYYSHLFSFPYTFWRIVSYSYVRTL